MSCAAVGRDGSLSEGEFMNKSSELRGLILEVPYSEKDIAKGLGAWWDPQIKKWFVPKGQDTKPFEKWIPESRQEEP